MNYLKLILSATILVAPIFSHAKLHGNESVIVTSDMYKRKYKEVSYILNCFNSYSMAEPVSGTYDEWDPYLIIIFHKDGTPAYICESDGGATVPIKYSSTNGDEIIYSSGAIEGNNELLGIKVIYSYGVAFIGGTDSHYIRLLKGEVADSRAYVQTIDIKCKEF